nr:hypothetical protein [Tanacetum cinerariifolium]
MAGNTMKGMTTNFGKLDKFEGHYFRRWQNKMHFLLTTLKVVYVLTTPMPELMEDDTVEAIRRRAKWENDDYIFRGHIEWIFGQYIQHGLKMDESIFVSSVIDKLPHSSLDFKHTLKHGNDDLSLVQLGSHLRIEEYLRAKKSDKGKGKKVPGPSVNMTEDGRKNRNNKQNKERNVVPMRTTVVLVPTRNLKWNIESVARLVTLRGIAVDAIAWWIDFGAKTHVCKDLCWFKTYGPVEDGSVLYMADDHFAHGQGKGSVVLEFSLRKSITLFNVLYVPKLRKNLISGHVLNKCGYKQVYESDKYILSKSGVFVGFGYYNNGIIHKTTAPYIPQQNGVAEKKNKALKEMVWGCRAVVRLPNPKRKSLGEKESRYAIFDENYFSSIPRPKDVMPNSDESQRDD